MNPLECLWWPSSDDMCFISDGSQCLVAFSKFVSWNISLIFRNEIGQKVVQHLVMTGDLHLMLLLLAMVQLIHLIVRGQVVITAGIVILLKMVMLIQGQTLAVVVHLTVCHLLHHLRDLDIGFRMEGTILTIGYWNSCTMRKDMFVDKYDNWSFCVLCLHLKLFILHWAQERRL